MKYKQCINCKKKKTRPILGDNYPQINGFVNYVRKVMHHKVEAKGLMVSFSIN